MKVNYLEDLHIPTLGEWSPTAVGDWIHPLHGKLPDHLGLIKCDEQDDCSFMGALWELPRAIVVMLERLDHEDPDPSVPMRHLDEVYSTSGWIAQTYRWAITQSGIKHGNRNIIPDPYEEADGWRVNVYRDILTESVQLAANREPSTALQSEWKELTYK